MPAGGEFAQTEKQTEIMNLILAAADAGVHHTYATLKTALSYGKHWTDNQARSSIKSSMVYLQKWGMVTIEYRNPHHRAHFMPTAMAYATFRRVPLSKS